jgi:CIC family chloride channel protein
MSVGSEPAPTGFDVVPQRPAVLTVCLFAAVVFVATGFAHLFRDAIHRVLEWYGDSTDPTAVADSLHVAVVFGIVTATVALAAALGLLVEHRLGRRLGIEAVAASARGESRRISVRATIVRTVATWSVSAGLTAIGRESAIVETGGALGSVAARRLGGRGDAMAAVGIAAAFSAAYHAPIAAILYVEEHLRVRRSRRALKFVVPAAIVAHVVSIRLMDGHAIFPDVQGSWSGLLATSLLVLVPAALAARLFLQVRVRVSGGALADRLRCPRWLAVTGLAAVAGLAVATFPLAAGNGMEALRHGSVEVGWRLALALLVGKLVGTAAALGAGAPGGVLSPTIGIAAGGALMAVLTAQSMGVGIDHPWDAMVMAMGVGVAVGMRSPLGAVFLIPEMLGDYTLVPVMAVVVGMAALLDRGLDWAIRRVNRVVPTGVYDEDA